MIRGLGDRLFERTHEGFLRDYLITHGVPPCKAKNDAIGHY